MTYLTQMRLNPARRGAMRLLSSPHAMHAAVLGGYALEDAGRVLWRLDRGDRNQVTLYVVGPHEPDLTHVVEQAGWPTTETWRTTAYTPFLKRLARGQAWRFRLTANPVRVEPPAPGAKRGVVRPHVTAEQQMEWLRSKCMVWGFEPLPDEQGGFMVQTRERDSFTKQDGPGGRRRVTVARATFTGVCQVTDADALRAALVAGMGRAKGYGCGLMTLAPVGM
ncbi:MAG: type I-E CRISPR-associated protein Cas6/Cse3/CasE [Kytococcus sp.]|nr:type I-E CRISPR-associated protein Cas6/Cse3/CasE [Kytococcus sp.]